MRTRLVLAGLSLLVVTATPTPNMNLSLPTPSVTSGPQWASMLNTALNAVDAHDHTSGKGKLVPTAGLNINADLSLNSYELNSAKGLKLIDRTLNPVSTGEVYRYGDDLYYNDGAGNVVRLTSAGSVVAGANAVSGTGNTGRLAVWSGTTTQTGYSLLAWDDVNSSLKSGELALYPIDATHFALKVQEFAAQTYAPIVVYFGDGGYAGFLTATGSWSGNALAVEDPATGSVLAQLTAADGGFSSSKQMYAPWFYVDGGEPVATQAELADEVLSFTWRHGDPHGAAVFASPFLAYTPSRQPSKVGSVYIVAFNATGCSPGPDGGTYLGVSLGNNNNADPRDCMFSYDYNAAGAIFSCAVNISSRATVFLRRDDLGATCTTYPTMNGTIPLLR